ncbi:PREDICTED: mRNA cap guanine-N7 methyltransferase isoform X2 [Polistes canadensis]|uniref:mRNA cap guanine-N7 methyltransferase isoform X2 n=1 Tax=Polistes canadensis TaxID=91411 RepID=UPI000718D102|nr:PREDICTED: mRNA cap guanine-N7 methyltransferase isoform X2 [Polistes canadensis]
MSRMEETESNLLEKNKLKTDTGQDASYYSSNPSDLSIGSSRNSHNISNNEKTDNTMLVAEHYNTLEETLLSQRNQSRIVYMRNFNNWIKSMLIDEYINKIKQNKNRNSPLKVLDMCCGKGGDLLKWKKKEISHLICVDIAEISIEQCKNRYSDILNKSSKVRGFAPIFTAEFIAVDCTKVRLREKYKDVTIQFDLVSCQFAFHYSFESLSQAECMLRNASECLRPGGYFIGTMPDAYDLASRWQKCDGVVNCPEFLVHLPTLCKLASKFGLELVMFERFETYYERMQNEGKSLLCKMQAMETYPPYHESPLLGKPWQDYQHAISHMQNQPGHRKIGTLSQSEWEVTSLYAVFAFQKKEID